jgi:hypothetical protein
MRKYVRVFAFGTSIFLVKSVTCSKNTENILFLKSGKIIMADVEQVTNTA